MYSEKDLADKIEKYNYYVREEPRIIEKTYHVHINGRRILTDWENEGLQDLDIPTGSEYNCYQSWANVDRIDDLELSYAYEGDAETRKSLFNGAGFIAWYDILNEIKNNGHKFINKVEEIYIDCCIKYYCIYICNTEVEYTKTSRIVRRFKLKEDINNKNITVIHKFFNDKYGVYHFENHENDYATLRRMFMEMRRKHGSGVIYDDCNGILIQDDDFNRLNNGKLIEVKA